MVISALYVIDFKTIRLYASTRNRIRCVFKSFPSGERFQKFPLWRAFSKVCGYSVRRTHVDESRIRNKMFADTNDRGRVFWYVGQKIELEVL